MVPVAAGRFRDTVIVEQVSPDAVKGPSGRVDLDDDDNWCTFTTCRAEVLAITAREQVYSQKPTESMDFRVTLRLTEITNQITSKMRVRWGCRTFQIIRAVPIGSPARLIELGCIEER